jgi:hypothetical protein
LHRLSLARQLLLLQMAMVVLVVGAVGWVSAVQADQTFRIRESRRLLATAEATATEGVVRGSLLQADAQEPPHETLALRTPMGGRLERVRAAADASYVLLVTPGGEVLATSVPLGHHGVVLRPDVRRGASWAGTGTRFSRKDVEAQVAVLADEHSVELARRHGETVHSGEVLGYLVLGRF